MKEVFIKADTFYNSELEQINRYAYRDFTNKDIISVEDLVVIIEELLSECESLEEELDSMEQNIRDNYKPISPYEMYGVSERDFH